MHPTESIYMCICVCVEESDLVGLHPAGGLLYEIKLDEGESSALTWTPPSAMATEQQQQQHDNNAVLGLVLHVQRRERPCISTNRKYHCIFSPSQNLCKDGRMQWQVTQQGRGKRKRERERFLTTHQFESELWT